MAKEIMLVKVYFTEECINNVFTQTGKEIGKEEVEEINFEEFTTEFREKFLLYTEKWNRDGKEVGRKFKIKTNVYPVDIEAVMSEINLRFENEKNETIEEVRRKNAILKCSFDYKPHCSYYYAYFYEQILEYRVGGTNYYLSLDTYKDADGMIHVTKEQLLADINIELPNECISTGMTDNELKNAVAEAFLVFIGKKNAEEVDNLRRMEQNRIELERMEAERSAYKEQCTAWIEAHGSDYLKTLLHEGLRVKEVFEKEFEEYETRRIFEQTGIDNTIHTDEEVDSDDDFDITTERIELSEWILDEEQLKKYVAIKQCEGFKDAYIQKVDIRNYIEESTEEKYKLVAKFETVLHNYELELL